MTITISPIAPITLIFKINDNLYQRAIDSLSAEELWRRPTDANNPILWLAGHVVQTRADMLRLMGEPFDTGWRDLFARGSSIGDAEKYPTIDEIKRIFGEVNEKLYAALGSLDDERIAQPFPGLPNANTAADQIAGFAFHDSYHVGQMAYVRKTLGYPAIAG